MINKLKIILKSRQIDKFLNTLKELTELNNKYSLRLSNDIEAFNNKFAKVLNK
ncbi:MAG: hypothetical protein ACTSPQ_05035 [Candidatus Helarchaeota archaeon]